MLTDRSYSQCPECVLQAGFELKAEMAEQYGKIPQEEWLGLKAQLTKALSAVSESGLQESGDMGIDNEGNFRMNYKAICSICGFTHKASYRTDDLLDRESYKEKVHIRKEIE